MELSATPISKTTPSVSIVSIPPLTILAKSCTVNCNISSQGGSDIIRSGVYYSINPFFDNQSVDEACSSTPGVGGFSVNLSGLIPSRTYYVRPFAENSSGISLGNMVTFITPKSSNQPTITSNPVTYITQTTAVAGGNVTLPGGTAITAMGICWNSSPKPTISNNTIPTIIGLGTFACNLSGLTANTTYYVRAYATNSNGTAYGDEVVFTTESTVTTVSDIEGNTYNTVQIGTQTWMKESLKTTKYSDGSSISNVTDSTQWVTQTTGAYCWYDNDAATVNKGYSALYNYYAVVDSRNLCPLGWHIPSYDELVALTDYLGGDKVAGGRLKEAGTAHWLEPNTGADNSSGFTALPNGFRYQGSFIGIYDTFELWAKTEYDSNTARTLEIYTGSESTSKSYDEKKSGLPVRCLKDK